MAFSEKLFLAAQRVCVISKRNVRDRFRPSLVALTGAGKTYEERLNELTKSDHSTKVRPNVGLPPVSTKLDQKEEVVKWSYLDRNATNRRAILDKISGVWLADNGPSDLQKIADHYDVFNHLFGEAMFFPQFDWQVNYKDGTNNSGVSFGNKIPAAACLAQPDIRFKSHLLSETSHWCLAMTALDGHLTNSNNGYLLWMVANLPGGTNDPLSNADVVVPYLPPFPMHGFGYCRVAFVLYKQVQGKIANPRDALRVSKVGDDLKSRNFSSIDWYQQLQEQLTPASLRFFQTVWDDSVTGTFHHTLQMKEPRYEYMTPEPHREEQLLRPPEDVPFNEYLDQYRDRKDIAEEVMKYYLYSQPNPLGSRTPAPKYPNLKRQDPRKVVSWIRDEEKNKNLRQGKWKNLPQHF